MPVSFSNDWSAMIVRHVAQLGGAAADAAGQHLLLGGDVEQGVLDLQAGAAGDDVADQQVLGAEGLPVAVDDFAGLARQADHVLPRNRLEHSRNCAGRCRSSSAMSSGSTAPPVPAEGHHGDRNGTVGAAGNHQGVCCLGHAGEQGQAEQSARRIRVFTELKSSGLKMTRR